MTSSLSSHSTSASVSERSRLVTHTAVSSPKYNSENRGVASFSKVRGMDVVCLLTIKKMNSMTEGYKRYNIQDIKSFPFK